MVAKPRFATIGQYLAACPPKQRAALERVRKTVRAAAPDAEECINYGVAAFRLGEACIAGFSASAGHLSYYPMSGATIAAHQRDLKGFETSKGAIKFGLDNPLPAALVKKLVKWRIEELKVPTTRGPAKARVGSGAATTVRHDDAVDSFIRGLDPTRRSEVESLRQLILAVSPDIREGIKWNAPSFRIGEWFATMNLRGKAGAHPDLWLILHAGAKSKSSVTVADPKGLLKWLGKDRALVTFADAAEIRSRRPALQRILREWIKQV